MTESTLNLRFASSQPDRTCGFLFMALDLLVYLQYFDQIAWYDIEFSESDSSIFVVGDSGRFDY